MSETGESPNLAAIPEANIDLIQTTTNFYREASAFTTIVKKLAPQFGKSVTVASVGCSEGQEVYGLLFLNQLAHTGVDLKVEGFDYNKKVLEIARSGSYSLNEIGGPVIDYSSAILNKLTGGLPESPGQFTMPEAIKNKASFSHHDISQDPLPRKYPIILCANVLYHHFRDGGLDNLNRVLNNIASSLDDGGYLVCENINGYKGPGKKEYAAALEAHPAFMNRNDLGVTFTHRDKGPGGMVTIERARVLQKKIA